MFQPLFLLHQLEKIPVTLGPLGTLLLALFTLASGVINLVQLSQRNSARRWETAAKAAEAAATAHESNLQAVRERADALTRENEEKAKRIGVLESRTDLESLRSQTSNIQRMFTEHAQRVDQRHESITLVLNGLATSVGDMNKRFLERDDEYSELIRAQSDLIKSLQSQVGLKLAMQT